MRPGRTLARSDLGCKQAGVKSTGRSGTVAVGAPGTGILIQSAANNNIGGTDPGAGNVIANCFGIGVQVHGPESTGNVVEGNRIGTNAAGNAALGQQNGTGVLMNSGASGNRIGGTSPAARNVISGNLTGVAIQGLDTTGNVVSGNFVGVSADGTARVPNIDGVFIGEGAHDNVIGGTVAGSGNVLSGNQRTGAILLGAGPGNRLEGNLIGTDSAGSGPLGNASFGILINSRSSDNIIGGTAPGAGNVISYNGGPGIQIDDAGGETNGIVIQGNAIGTDRAGTIAAGNGNAGVLVVGTLTTQGVHNIRIGGAGPGAANQIRFNGRDGVTITGPGASGVTVRGNVIDDNGGLGIDLGDDDGVTPNDPGDVDTGANGLQNFPVVAAAVAQPGGTRIVGSLSGAASAGYTIDFYASRAPDPSGYGEGRRWLGSISVVANAAGAAHFMVLFGANVPKGQVITATATDAAGNTSEFSKATRVVVGRAMNSRTLAGVANAPPEITVNDELFTSMDQRIVFNGKAGAKGDAVVGKLAIDDANARAKGVSFVVTIAAQSGTLSAGGVAAGATVSFTGPLSDINSRLSTLVYQPAAGFSGADALHVEVVDAGDRNATDDTAISMTDVAIQVGDFNRAPVIALPDALETSVDRPIDFNPKRGGDTAITLTDPDGTRNTQYVIQVQVDHGTLSAGSAATGAMLSAAGNRDDINRFLARLKYQPDGGFTGADTLHIVVTDLGDPKIPVTTTASADLTIHVGPFNHPPVIKLPTAPETPINTRISFGRGGAGKGTSAVPIRMSDSDDRSPKRPQSFSITLTVDYGTFIRPRGEISGPTLTINGTRDEVNNALADLVYQPNADFVGVDVMTIRLTDFGDPANPADDVTVEDDLGIFVG